MDRDHGKSRQNPATSETPDFDAPTVKIPDVWYDFYARFLPGVTFVEAYCHLVNKAPLPSDGIELIAHCFIGFVVGFITSPFSSAFATFCLEKWFKKQQNPSTVFNDDHPFIYGSARVSLIISKMRAEIVALTQFSLLGVLLALFEIENGDGPEVLLPTCAIALVALLGAADTARRRARRIAQFSSPQRAAE